ncbi:MAG TPA: ABC transporter permease subunit [Herbaspirillum sp.]|jgi:NitT/TauT family transport system permease protein/phthalate transport system permease protein
MKSLARPAAPAPVTGAKPSASKPSSKSNSSGDSAAPWRKRCRHWAGKLLPFLVLLVLWQLIASTQPAYVFPSLGMIFKTIVSLAQDGILWSATWSTIQAVLLAAFIAMFSGTVIGFWLARYETFTTPLLNFVQTIPYVVWALMSLIWFGLTKTSVVFTIVIAAFPLVSFNVAAGLKSVDPLLLGMAQSVRGNRAMVLRHIIMPSLTPYLVSAGRSMLGMCWKICVLAELFAGGASGGGVGYNLYAAWEFSRPGEVFGWTVWLVILMMVSDRLFIVPLELLATRWKRA